MNIQVYTITYNEEFILPHFIKHYKEKFNAHITVFDNFSTDRTKEIIVNSDCEYKTYDSAGQIRDDLYLSIKNECWKGSKADFVIVCDADEFLEVNFDYAPYNLIRTQGYDMIGAPPSRLGVKNNMYSKAVMFRPSEYAQIGYAPGCHFFQPQPKNRMVISKETAKLLHYKYISPEYLYERHLMYQSRLSSFNKIYGYGIEYNNVQQDKINTRFNELLKGAALV